MTQLQAVHDDVKLKTLLELLMRAYVMNKITISDLRQIEWGKTLQTTKELKQ